ncbi:MAG: hypothetical protein C0594_16785 [Marinilabiliales bacterium]|nr:MAG: hypothetical protein C0594_16785 [Marinilabiliales bacterium]
MSQKQPNYILSLFIISTILAGAGWLIFNFLFPAYYFNIFPAVILFFLATALISHRFINKMFKQKPSKFVNSFMLLSFIRLLIYLFGVLIFLFYDKENAIPFVVSLFVCYVVYSVTEVIYSLRLTKNKKAQ